MDGSHLLSKTFSGQYCLRLSYFLTTSNQCLYNCLHSLFDCGATWEGMIVIIMKYATLNTYISLSFSCKFVVYSYQPRHSVTYVLHVMPYVSSLIQMKAVILLLSSRPTIRKY